jgi:hypothetical protein
MVLVESLANILLALEIEGAPNSFLRSLLTKVPLMKVDIPYIVAGI